MEAEQCLNYENIFYLMMKNTPKPFSTQEAVCSSAVKTSDDIVAIFNIGSKPYYSFKWIYCKIGS